jgi:hypothetical protein
MLRPVMWPSSVWKLQEYKCICSVGITLQLKSYSFGLNVTNFNQNCTILTVEWCRHYKYVCILAHTTLKMVTWVAETCRLALYNKITLTERKWICWSFKGFFFYIWLLHGMWNIPESLTSVLEIVCRLHFYTTAFRKVGLFSYSRGKRPGDGEGSQWSSDRD